MIFVALCAGSGSPPSASATSAAKSSTACTPPMRHGAMPVRSPRDRSSALLPARPRDRARLPLRVRGASLPHGRSRSRRPRHDRDSARRPTRRALRRSRPRRDAIPGFRAHRSPVPARHCPTKIVVIAVVVPLLLHRDDQRAISIANNCHRRFSLCKHRFPRRPSKVTHGPRCKNHTVRNAGSHCRRDFAIRSLVSRRRLRRRR